MTTAPEISPADWACADWADPIGFGLNDERHGRAYAAMMARTGWTPPELEPVDPDLEEADKLSYAWHVGEIKDVPNLALASIKRGRALAAAEAKPGMVWVKHDGSDVCPVKGDTWVWSKGGGSGGGWGVSPDQACDLAWPNVTHYTIITQPEEK